MTGKRRPADQAERIEITSRAQWRAWLETNHRRSDPVWLVTYKKHCGDRHVPWRDVVQEAICFGWIDSRTRRVDEDRTMVYVSPRRTGSIWSQTNKRHVAELEAAGLLAPAGIAKIREARRDGSWEFLDDVDALIVPDDLAKALDDEPQARVGFEAIKTSERKRLLYWLKTAASPTTRARRIERIVKTAATGQ